MEEELYTCLDCGRVFDADSFEHLCDTYPYGDGTAEEWYAVCRCGSTHWERAGRCLSCGTWAGESELDEGLCPACRRDAMRRLRRFLFEELTVEQRQWVETCVMA